MTRADSVTSAQARSRPWGALAPGRSRTSYSRARSTVMFAVAVALLYSMQLTCLLLMRLHSDGVFCNDCRMHGRHETPL